MWIVVNIGFIECGVTSDIVGVFSNKKRANDLAEKLMITHAWRQGGQNSFEVFPMPNVDEVNKEYATTNLSNS